MKQLSFLNVVDKKKTNIYFSTNSIDDVNWVIFGLFVNWDGLPRLLLKVDIDKKKFKFSWRSIGDGINEFKDLFNTLIKESDYDHLKSEIGIVRDALLMHNTVDNGVIVEWLSTQYDKLIKEF